MILFVMFAFGAFYSCGVPCEKRDCGNGLCTDDVCVCNTGYEKGSNTPTAKCDIKGATRYTGTWILTDSCGTATTREIVVVDYTAAADALKVSVSFDFIGVPFDATVFIPSNTNSHNGISFTEKDLGNNIFVEGEGTFVSGTPGKVNWTLIYSDKTDPLNIIKDTCNSVWTYKL